MRVVSPSLPSSYRDLLQMRGRLSTGTLNSLPGSQRTKEPLSPLNILVFFYNSLVTVKGVSSPNLEDLDRLEL